MRQSSTHKKFSSKTEKDLKNKKVQKTTVQKGYNEKNPTEEQGAFKPDNAKN